MRRPSLVLLVIAAAAWMAGCTAPADFLASATAPVAFVSSSYSYDGSAARPASGHLSVSLDAMRNRGHVSLDVVSGSDRFATEWTSFSGTAPYQSGGVARGVRLAGATGNGSSELPGFFSYAAAWGESALKVGGHDENDPTTGHPFFSARLFVLQGHVRSATTHAIYGRDGKTPYNPAHPDDAFVDSKGAQALVEFRTASGELWRHFEFDDVTLQRI